MRGHLRDRTETIVGMPRLNVEDRPRLTDQGAAGVTAESAALALEQALPALDPEERRRLRQRLFGDYCRCGEHQPCTRHRCGVSP
jgi:hypothetical protein